MKIFIKVSGAAVLSALLLLSFTAKERFQSENISEVKELPMMNNVAFKRGEKLSFRLHYGVIDAGVATLTVTDENLKFGGRSTFHVVGLGSSNGMFDWFFKVRDRYESYIDEKALVPWMFVRRIDEGGYKASQDYVFNPYHGKVKIAEEKTIDVTPNIQDMVSSLYYMRNIDLSNAKIGDVFSVDCLVDGEIFPAKIKFIGRETLKTNLGKFNCLKFCPLIQKGRIFKHEEDLKIWITDDKNHIPIKAKAKVLVGSIQMELTGYSGLANPIAKL